MHVFRLALILSPKLGTARYRRICRSYLLKTRATLLKTRRLFFCPVLRPYLSFTVQAGALYRRQALTRHYLRTQTLPKTDPNTFNVTFSQLCNVEPVNKLNGVNCPETLSLALYRRQALTGQVGADMSRKRLHNAPYNTFWNTAQYTQPL